MLKVNDLHKTYQVGKTTYEVLKGVSLEIEKGQFVAVMGPSGSGKTTLLNCISCYIPADAGSICLGGRELAALNEEELAAVRNRELGFVFQDFLLLDGLTARDNILLPAITGTGAIYAFYAMIMYANDDRLSLNELAGMGACLLLILIVSLLMYAVYRMTLRRVCQALDI